MSDVLVASVPHTGTQFVIEALRPHFSNIIQVDQLRDNPTMLHDDTHKGYMRDQSNLIWGHLILQNLQIIQALALRTPMIVPLRDPLLSIISFKHRHTHHADIVVNRWLRLVKHIAPHEPFWFPIDQLDAVSISVRTNCIYALFDSVKLPPPWWENVVKLGAEWPLVNSHGDYPLKQAYHAGAWDFVRRELGGAYDMLRAHAHTLRPFLEAQGYRNLVWWI